MDSPPRKLKKECSTQILQLGNDPHEISRIGDAFGMVVFASWKHAPQWELAVPDAPELEATEYLNIMKKVLRLTCLAVTCLQFGCTSDNTTTLHTKGKAVTVKIRKSNGWTASGVITKNIQLKGGWAILTTMDGRVLIYPRESVIDIVVPKG